MTENPPLPMDSTGKVPKHKALSLLANPAEFREELQRVQARIERTNCFFSVIIFDVGGAGNRGLDVDLAHTLLNRTRVSDFVGWFDRRKIGVILDGCLICSAISFGNAVSKHISAWRRPPRQATIQTFPSRYKVDHLVGQGLCDGKDCSGCGERTDRKSGPLTCPTLCIQKSGFLPSSVIVEYGTNIGVATRPPAGAGLPLWKRAMDIAVSLICLIVLSPVLGIAALLIKITSPGPVIFRQERVGYLGHHFILYKFRSMTIADAHAEHESFMKHVISGEGDEADEPMLKEKTGGHARTTWIGRILRNTCFDEIPQLINILKGDMSLVGPRPPIPYEVEVYRRWHGGRFDSVPGLTGLWQVSGKNRLSFKEMARLDIQYSRNLSIWNDLKILFLTPLAVIQEFRDGLRMSAAGKEEKAESIANAE